jgi:transcriptional regulator with XRE-family HTH domain
MPKLRTPVADTLAASTAREIRAEMSRQGVTQEVLAERLGCGQRLLSRRLTAEVPIDTAELDRIAKALGVPVTQFLPTPARAA